MKLLYAEDEPALSDAVSDVLAHHNYTVDVVQNGADAVDYALVGEYDGFILDIMMPKKDGFQVLREIREKGISAPVLMLTAKNEIDDRVSGLSLGADDYLVKPFAMRELLARIRAMLRRRDTYLPDIINYGNTSLDPSRMTLTTPTSCCDLSRLEFQIFEILMLNQEVKVSSNRILEEVWGYDAEVEKDTLWVYISQLRKKLTELDSTLSIKSKRGIGYSLEEKR